MNVDIILNMIRDALVVIMSVAAPPLISGLVVGLLVSIFQAVTSIQEATLAFIPKILMVLISIVIFGNFMFTTVQDFAIELIRFIPEFIANK